MSSSDIRPGKPYIYTSPVSEVLAAEHTGWLYRYYDATGDLLYIEVTIQRDGGRDRWHHHWADKNTTSPWAVDVQTVFVTPTFGDRPEVFESQAIVAERPLCNKNLPLEARTYSYVHRDRYANLGLQSFPISAYNWGLDWLPGWLGSAPETHYHEDPWITDPDADRTRNRFAVGAGGRFVSDFSRQIYMSALMRPRDDEMQQGIRALAM